MPTKPKLLYVDDEVDNLIVFKSAFRRDYDVLTAQSAPDALEILKDTNVALVITDQRMPGMTGIELLKSLPEEPEMMRIILTGFSDIEAVIEAINSGKVFQYITKPWDKEKLKWTIDKAIETLGLKTYNKELVEQLKQANTSLERKVEERTREIAGQKEQIEEQKQLLEREKMKTDKLLRNILPEEVAEELKQKGHSKAKRYENVTVLFADFVNFTLLSDTRQPEEVVSQLDCFFRAFDEIIEDLGLEKIKTIGDAYMCAGGVPLDDEEAAIKIIRAAKEMQEFVAQASEDKDNWLHGLRIGIHSGPVVAGVVGKIKFAYDIWGDTVNKASRLESASEAGEVNVSEETMLLTKDHFNYEFRGEFDVKGKGKMKMYFLR